MTARFVCGLCCSRLEAEGDVHDLERRHAEVCPGRAEPSEATPLAGAELLAKLREAVSPDTANRAAMRAYLDRGLPLPEGAPVHLLDEEP